MRVAKWGDSLAVRLPKILVDALSLEAGDELEAVDGPGAPGGRQGRALQAGARAASVDADYASAGLEVRS